MRSQVPVACGQPVVWSGGTGGTMDGFSGTGWDWMGLDRVHQLATGYWRLATALAWASDFR